MATAHFVIANFPSDRREGQAPLAEAGPVTSQSITTTGSNQVTSIEVPAAKSGVTVWSVTALGGDMAFAFGIGTPDATVAAARWLVPSGQTREFSAQPGQKGAVVNA